MSDDIDPMKVRAREFARIVMGVDDLSVVNMEEDAQWRRLLDAIDFAIASDRGFTVEWDESGNAEVSP